MASCLLPARCHVAVGGWVELPGEAPRGMAMGRSGSTWRRRGTPTATPRLAPSTRRCAVKPPSTKGAPSTVSAGAAPPATSAALGRAPSSRPGRHTSAPEPLLESLQSEAARLDTPLDPCPATPARRAEETFLPACPCCSRRGLLIAGLSLASAASAQRAAAAAGAGEASLEASLGASSLLGRASPGLGNGGSLAVLSSNDSLAAALLAAKQGRPQWVDELYAYLLGAAGDTYETRVGDLKQELFAPLLELEKSGKFSRNRPLDILEVGVGSGPNMKLYASNPGSNKNIRVTGVDPNGASQKYAAASASAAGLGPGQFSFLQGVGEGIPLADKSVDVAITTLVLCSVADVQQTVSEVFRVLRPGGQYLFLEHVAAAQGTPLRFWQNTLDPLQQFVADGCHLAREPLPFMESAGFAKFDARHLNVPGLSLLSPHLVGRAFKA